MAFSTQRREAMTRIGFVDNRGALGGLGYCTFTLPQIASGKPGYHDNFARAVADRVLLGPVRVADRTMDQIGGDDRKLAALRPGRGP